MPRHLHQEIKTGSSRDLFFISSVEEGAGVELPGARASQNRPVNGSAASGLSRPKGPARTQHASEAKQAVGSRQDDCRKRMTKSDYKLRKTMLKQALLARRGLYSLCRGWP